MINLIGCFISAFTTGIFLWNYFSEKLLKEKEKVLDLTFSLKVSERHLYWAEESMRSLKKQKLPLKRKIETLSELGTVVNTSQEQIDEILTNLHGSFSEDIRPILDEIKIFPVRSFHEIKGYYCKITLKF